MLVGQAQFVTKFTVTGDLEEMICVWGYDKDEADFSPPQTSSAHQAYDVFAEFLLPVLPALVTLTGLDQEEAVEGGVLTSSWNEDQVGAGGGNMVPQNTALLIHKRTSGIGAGKNGRCYLPGVGEGNVTNTGVLDSTFRDAVSDSMTNMIAAFDGTVNPELVVNRGLRVDPLDPPPRIPSVVPVPLFWYVNGADCDPLVATQRRRLRK